MPTLPDIRRENLAHLVKEAGGTAAFARLLGSSDSQIAQWMHGAKESRTGKPRGMSHDTCRRIERSTGRPPGWMDQAHDAGQAAQPEVTLHRALEVLGHWFARDVPAPVRLELAEAVATWVRWGGRDSYRDTVEQILGQLVDAQHDRGT